MNNLLPHHGELYYLPHFVNHSTANNYFLKLKQSIVWDQKPITIFGKKVMQPRLTAWYGDSDVSYKYSGLKLTAMAWTDELLHLKNKIEQSCGHKFNSVLLNYYRNGSDSMGWHRDNESELGENPIIASLSLGQSRKFKIRNYFDKKETFYILVETGSLLLMKSEMQTYWEHSIAKELKVAQPRINLTFRYVQKG